MRRGEYGTWYLTVRENLENWYYLYQVTNYDQTQTAVDPYVKAVATNAQRGMILDLRKTNPEGWEADPHIDLTDAVDAIIYEVHVRDFSIHENSGMQYKGKYLAFTEQETTGPGQIATGVASLKELGITHIQVQPVTEFASIDETKPDQYNWGYDPRNYDVPEGAYATTPHGTERILDYKKMIHSLHEDNLGIVMDVVYNHTFAIQISDFDKIVPHYYYRTDIAGNYTNGSGVGNEMATERPMVQKFVGDSLKYWVNEYHINGFRFDLMALLGVATMSKVVEDLHSIDPHLLLYGEPWPGGASGLANDQLLFKGRQKGLRLGVFNDNIRNGLIGSVFDAQAQGFASGANGASGSVDVVRRAVEGSINDFTSAPGETINYVTSHDNMTLWDKINASNAAASEEQRIWIDMLAQAVIMTSQGVAFMQGGEEFLRTKSGNDNSYNAGDAINQFDWARKAQYKQVFDYYAGLIGLRRRHPAFRLPTADLIRQHLTFIDSPDNTIAFCLQDYANGDRWKHLLVCYNPNQHDIMLPLPDGNWTVVVTQGKVDEQGIETVSKTVCVKEISCMVLYQD
jgi:pullulanase